MRVPKWLDDYYENMWPPALIGRAIYDLWQWIKRRRAR